MEFTTDYNNQATHKDSFYNILGWVIVPLKRNGKGKLINVQHQSS